MGRKRYKQADEDLLAELGNPSFATVELAGNQRLILKLDDGRMFGVALVEPMGKDESLPARAELKVPYADETGVPQNAEFIRFI